MKKRIREILYRGRVYNSRFFRLHCKTENGYKIGFIARHNIGNPVKRNRIKRVIRENWKKRFQKGDYIFVIKPALINSPIELLKTELEKIADAIECKKH